MTENPRKQEALDYHEKPRPGKLAIAVTKPFTTPSELALAYTPGVAEPVRAIMANPDDAYRYTSKGNLVAVISDGSAVLGLGKAGALASKPVMEGKAVLFKKFADVDVFDIEVESETPEQFIDTVSRIGISFGGINLEDIAAPHCFAIESALRDRLDVPVFHDDQHGTAIIVAAGLLNALELQGKTIADARIVCLGAGAAGIASLRLCHALGASKDNISVIDRAGVIYADRDNLPDYKAEFARTGGGPQTLAEAMHGADVFIGVSGPGLVDEAMIASMADKPVVFALSNPVPEILPEIANKVRPDLIMATGRSDFPNQVNNVLGFPFIFRGALDVHASDINQQMHLAAVEALRRLAHEPVPATVLDAYEREHWSFGPDYIIPTPLDPRLIDVVPQAVARAAVDSGVARAPYPEHY